MGLLAGGPISAPIVGQAPLLQFERRPPAVVFGDPLDALDPAKIGGPSAFGEGSFVGEADVLHCLALRIHESDTFATIPESAPPRSENRIGIKGGMTLEKRAGVGSDDQKRLGTDLSGWRELEVDPGA